MPPSRSSPYRLLREGEWFRPILKHQRMACCGCGLVTEWEFRRLNGQLHIRKFINRRSTAQLRRHFKPLV